MAWALSMSQILFLIKFTKHQQSNQGWKQLCSFLDSLRCGKYRLLSGRALTWQICIDITLHRHIIHSWQTVLRYIIIFKRFEMNHATHNTYKLGN